MSDSPLFNVKEENRNQQTENPDPVEPVIDGTLDLHGFDPREITTLIRDYLDVCRDRNICSLRIIHGKGTGTLRRTVHAQLRKISYVRAFRLAGEDGGSWGATLVDLVPKETAP